MGVLIEAWKITKIIDIKLIPAAPGSLIPFSGISFEDKKELSEDEKKTQECASHLSCGRCRDACRLIIHDRLVIQTTLSRSSSSASAPRRCSSVTPSTRSCTRRTDRGTGSLRVLALRHSSTGVGRSTHFHCSSMCSFVVTTLAQSVYMFGFVQLIPQLIISA